MAGMSPTQLTLRHFRRLGYTAEVTERWNPFAKIRQDLFGCIDVLVVGHGETIGVQCTSKANISSRAKKIAEADAVADLREADWKLLVQGWYKVGNRWHYREIDVS